MNIKLLLYSKVWNVASISGMYNGGFAMNLEKFYLKN